MPQLVRRSGLVVTLLALGLMARGAALADPADAPAAAASAPEAPASAAAAAAPDDAASAPVDNSSLDAQMFFQLLYGELELGGGNAGAAYQVLLDAARRTKDERLFEQVVEIALKAHAGDQALAAARDWRDAHPDSVKANQSVVRLMAALDKIDGIVEPLRSLLALAPAEQRVGMLASIPLLFQRSPEPAKVLATLEPFLEEQGNRPGLRDVSLYVRARLAIAAGDKERALARVQALAASAPTNGDAVQMAVELMPTVPQAESIVTDRIAADPQNTTLRLAYARALARMQRTADATREFRRVTEMAPDASPAWLALGALELEQRHTAAARPALLKYLELVPEVDGQTPDAGLESVVGASSEARRQAMLMLAQADEQDGDLKGAEAWLAKVKDAGNPVELAYRRASLLARQGRLAEGVKLLDALPDSPDEAARAKLLAIAQLKRESNDLKGAYDSLAAGGVRFKSDPDVIYERAMLADRLGHDDEMEKLLRQVIALKPDYYNAYNALGYSLAERNTRLDEARKLVEKALALAPNQPALMDSLGWVEYRQGHLPEALDLLRKAYAAFPDGEVAAHLGEVLWKSGQADEARRVWDEALRREPENDTLKDTMTRYKAQP
ncbi:MAG: tetratricopeptide repeat protein [Pelomonas sp.]|nr:tetratricopeptide repeat protein [Roseateles sp.]